MGTLNWELVKMKGTVNSLSSNFAVYYLSGLPGRQHV